MGTIEVNGKSYETDEEGYLVNLSDWDADVANYIAGTENIDMTDPSHQCQCIWLHLQLVVRSITEPGTYVGTPATRVTRP